MIDNTAAWATKFIGHISILHVMVENEKSRFEILGLPPLKR